MSGFEFDGGSQEGTHASCIHLHGAPCLDRLLEHPAVQCIWLGEIDPSSGLIAILDAVGPKKAVAEPIRDLVNAAPESRGRLIQAVISRRPVVVQDASRFDDAIARVLAEQGLYGACIVSVPTCATASRFTVAYADRPDSWRPELVQMVVDVSRDLAETGADVPQVGGLKSAACMPHSFLAEAIEAAPVAVATLDMDGRVRTVNAAAERMLDRESGEIVNRTIVECIDGGFGAEFEGLVGRILAGESVDALEGSLDLGDDRRYWLRVYGAPVTCPVTGAIEGAIVVAQDITGEHIMRQRIQANADQQTERAIHLVDLVEHERRSIAETFHDDVGQNLAAAKLRVQMLLARADEFHLDERVRQSLTALVGTLSLVTDTARLTARELRDSDFETLGLEGAIEAYVERLRGVTQTHWVTRIRNVPVSVEVGGIIYRAARELVVNAAKHASAMNVWIELDQQDESVVLAVRDDGVGMPPGGADAAGRRSGGLSVIRKQVELAGGRLEVGSGEEGTSVAVHFPLPRAGLAGPG